MDAEVEGLHAASSSSIVDKCRQLDKGLAAALKSGDIRLLRRAWVLEAPEHLPYRQVLEERERRGESPLLSPEEAAALLARGDRSIGALTQCAPHVPEPPGSRRLHAPTTRTARTAVPGTPPAIRTRWASS